MTIEKLVREAYSDVFKTEVQKTAASVGVDAKKVAASLTKVAGLPYTPEAYGAVCEIMKIASGTIEGMLASLESERSKVSGLEKLSEVRGIVDEMLERGMIDLSGVHEKTSELLKKNEKQLEIVKEAMCLVSDKSGYGHVDSNPDGQSSEKREMFGTVIN